MAAATVETEEETWSPVAEAVVASALVRSALEPMVAETAVSSSAAPASCWEESLSWSTIDLREPTMVEKESPSSPGTSSSRTGAEISPLAMDRA